MVVPAPPPFQPTLQPSLVPFVPGLFPELYRTGGNPSLYVAFMLAFQEWSESANSQGATTYWTRSFPDLRDVDRTTDEFFVHLKTQYLDGIRLGTESDSRLLLKHAKDLYSAKGTPRGLRLFFRLLYDEEVGLYYPKDDILRMSSGTWTLPTYLELSIVPEDWKLAGQAVVGLTSGATAFVDAVSRRVMAGRLASTAFVSAVTGAFQTGEIVAPVSGSVPVSACPSVVGSMNSLLFDASGSGAGYSVGQVVPVVSSHGVLGEARVTETVTQSGIISPELEAGGYGYTNAAALIVSDTVVSVSGVTLSNAYARKYFCFEEGVTQSNGSANVASGWVVGSSNCSLQISSNTGAFQVGEVVVQGNPLWPLDGSVVGSGVVFSATPSFVALTGLQGVFRPGSISGQTSGSRAVVSSVDVTLGLVTLSGAWTNASGNFLSGAHGSNGTVTFKSSAITSAFGVATLVDTEVVELNTDSLAGIASANLSGPFPLAANASANATTPLSQCLTFANATVGSIANLYTITPGQQLDAQPIVAAFDPRIGTLNQYDLTAYLSGATGSFSTGEFLTQAATGARGLVTGTSNGSVTMTDMRMGSNSQFVPTVNSTTVVVGSLSGSVANVASVWANRDGPPTGRDASVTAQATSSSGAVAAAQVVDSGFGFVQGEQVYLGTGAATPNSAFGLVSLRTMGTARGFYSQTGGFMSSSKKLFDGTFYQEFSYQVSSSHQIDEWQDSFKRIMHVAGMALFGRYVHSRAVGNPVSSPGGCLRSVTVA